jgi:hypothetical protein
MTLTFALLWLLFGAAMLIVGARGGVLLNVSRGLDRIRAAIHCAEVCLLAVRQTWNYQWPESLRWAQRDR